jgi:SPP1 family predicted phage head-tail adaptor
MGTLSAGVINAGDLKRYVTAQQRSTLRTGSGDQSTKWINLFSAYAQIEPASGREKFSAGDIRNEATHNITMRYNPLLVGANRIVWKGRYFIILGRPRNVDEDGVMMEFEAQEGLATQ